MARKLFSTTLHVDVSLPDTGGWPRLLRAFLPTPGNVLFTLLVIAALLWTSSAGALPQSLVSNLQSPSTSTIAYQGRLADSAGNPITDTVNMIFRLYDVASGGVHLWEEQWTGPNGVQVSDGLFNVMLGSLTQIPMDVITGHDTLWLGITVGTDDEMTPRVQLGSVPFAVQALTVPDGSMTTEKIADGAVTEAKLDPSISLEPPNGSITTAKIADGAVTSAKLNVDNSLAVNGGVVLSADEGGAFPFQLQIRGRSNPNKTLTLGFHTIDDYGMIQSHISGSGSFNTPLVLNPSGGKVGIGTTNPSEKLHVIGNILASGSKSAVVNTANYGQRKLYAFEQASNRFADEGKARLVNGLTRVNVDPIFLETIEGDFLIHVTPYGNAVLYVAEIGQDYFVVKAREGSDDVAFAWLLTAARKGYAGVRLEAAD